jgi:hypothetical protein
MIPKKYRGYLIMESSGGGKAGKGRNRTASIQVSEPAPHGCLVKKHFRYNVGDGESKGKAIEKAYSYIDDLPFIRDLVCSEKE